MLAVRVAQHAVRPLFRVRDHVKKPPPRPKVTDLCFQAEQAQVVLRLHLVAEAPAVFAVSLSTHGKVIPVNSRVQSLSAVPIRITLYPFSITLVPSCPAPLAVAASFIAFLKAILLFAALITSLIGVVVIITVSTLGDGIGSLNLVWAALRAFEAH